MIIQVTQEDIDNAWELHLNKHSVSCLNCPVALALRRAGFAGAAVVCAGIIQIPGREWIRPLTVANFVAQFDSDRKHGKLNTSAKPFEFDLDSPQDSV